MDHDAAREGLVGVEGDLEALAELAGDLVPVALRRNHLRIAPWRLDRFRARGESVLREQRRGESRASRAPGVEGLRHRAELLAKPDRLRGGDAERPGRVL